MQQTYYTSDLHFFHKSVCTFNKRPWTNEENTERLIDTWNTMVKPGDTTYSLGDFAFLPQSGIETLIQLIECLNGNKVFILGNHDDPRLWAKVQKANLSRVLFVGDYRKVKVNGQEIVMSHYPFEVWNRSHYGSWHLHGHCHGSMPVRGKRLDVGIDNHVEHRFFTFEEIESHMKNFAIWAPDNHKPKSINSF